MCRVEAAEEVGELREAYGRVIEDARLKQIVDARGRAPLQHIDIDTGVEEQLRTGRDRRLDEREIRSAAPPHRIGGALRLDPP